jgi:hypothetical protein
MLISLGCLSASVIAFQLVLMQILSIVQWYHFAYMVISVGLLGFGAAGTFISVFKKWLFKRIEILLPLLMLLSGTTMALVVLISQYTIFRFDSLLLFSEYSYTYKLLFTYLLFFIPFFLGALPIGLIFAKYVNRIGKLYFSNLIGSGTGGIMMIGLFWIVFPNELPAIIALLPVISGVLVIQKKSKMLLLVSACISVFIIFYVIVNPPGLVLSEFKSLEKTLNSSGSKITFKKCSPFGLVDVVYSPTLRYAPGLSLSFKKTVHVKNALFVNGDWLGPIISRRSSDSTSVMDYTTNALPYSFGQRKKILILDAGTGKDIALSMDNKAGEIIAVEQNPVVPLMLKKEIAAETGSLFDNPSVRMENIEPRTFLLKDKSKYDLIVLPDVGSFGGTSGLLALKEQFVLTKEAFSEIWGKLYPNGVISITCWMDYPARNILKILSTIAEVLEEGDIYNPTDYIAAVRSWGTVTFTVKKTPLNSEEINKIRIFCASMLFDPAVLPDITMPEREKYNKLQDENFFDYLENVLSSQRNMFYSNYDFNIKPATDDRPYFSQFVRWNSISNLKEQFGGRTIPFFEVGYIIVILTFVQITVVAIVLILVPLFKIGFKGGNKLWTLVYFTGIGVGYMFVEIVFIQRFILYFGNPIYSAAFVISIMLIFSGIGSYFSSRVGTTKKAFLIILSVVTIVLIIYSLMLTPALRWTIAYSYGVKILFALLFLVPVSFFMGIPFPIGLSYLSIRDENVVPWAWGINGCVSVISTVLAIIVSVELGFTWVMVFASIAYFFAFSINLRKQIL